MWDWARYILEDFRCEFAEGSRVLDVGCGEGWQLTELAGSGGWSCGIDPSIEALQICRTRALPVVRGQAERLPFSSESFDGVICKVVLPYVNETAAIDEIGRVLRPGGRAYFVSHGAGYYLRYLLQPPRFVFRLYGARALANTWLYAATGQLLPGFLGDTLYQSRRRLRKRYRSAGLELDREFVRPKYLGFPVFLYDHVRKAGEVMSAAL